MSKPPSSLSEQPPSDLLKHVAELAQRLGIAWSGPGGVVPDRAEDGRPAWRVYSHWAGLGALAFVDPTTGSLLSIDEERFESRGALKMPDALRPSAEEAREFLRSRIEVLGWEFPADLHARWDAQDDVWRFDSLGMQPRFRAIVRGKRGHLRLANLSRI